MRLALSALFLLIGAAALGAQAERPTPVTGSRSEIPAVFRSEVRLHAKIDAAYKSEPLRDVLAGLEKQLGVKLAVTRDVADDKITLFLKQRPAAEVLALIATHLDFQWYRNRGVFELTQDNGGKRREAALREAQLDAYWNALQDRIQRLSQLGGTPREKLEERRNELGNQLRDATGEDRARIMGELNLLMDLTRPGSAPAVALLRALNPVQLQQLRAGGEVRLSTADGTLAPAVASQIHAAADDRGASERQVFSLRTSPPPSRVPAAPAPAADLPPIQADVTLLLTPRPSMGLVTLGARVDRSPKLEVRMNSVRGDAQGRRVQPVVWTPSFANTYRIAQAGPPGQPLRAAPPEVPVAETKTEDPALLREVELSFKSTRPQPEPGSTLPTGVRFVVGPPTGLLPLSELAEKLHAATGLEIVADSYVRARLDPGRVSGKKQVVQILDLVAGTLDYQWTKEGDRIALRSRFYYEDRPLEVPERVLKPVREELAAAGGLGLDELAGLAAALNDRQLEGMQDHWTWYLEGPGFEPPIAPMFLYSQRSHLRFWATLNRAQREAALAGGVVPVRQMTAVQRQSFLAALTSPPDQRFAPAEGEVTATPAELAAGGFSLKSTEQSQQLYRGGGEDGKGAMVIVGSTAGGGPPRVPMIEGVQLQPVGPPSISDNVVFSYLLGGQEKPRRTARFQIPRPKPRKGQA